MRFSRTAMASRFIAWLVLALVIGTTTVAVGQVTSGSINGTVRDATGGVIPGATVTVANPSTGVARTVTTNDTGDFVVPNLPPGDYTIRVEAQGFKALEKSDVRLSATDRLNAGVFELELGGTAEVVNVTAGAGELQLQANSGERSDLITGNQLNNLALNGRNIIDFVKVVPGIVSSFDGQVAGTGGIDAFNVNGTRANQHEFTIDGSSNVDTGNNGGTHVTLNPDAVAEMKILTSNYQAEFGKAGGGQLVVTTKSGSRDFHGSGRYFARNEALNANSWFANQEWDREVRIPLQLLWLRYRGTGADSQDRIQQHPGQAVLLLGPGILSPARAGWPGPVPRADRGGADGRFLADRRRQRQSARHLQSGHRPALSRQPDRSQCAVARAAGGIR